MNLVIYLFSLSIIPQSAKDQRIDYVKKIDLRSGRPTLWYSGIHLILYTIKFSFQW